MNRWLGFGFRAAMLALAALSVFLWWRGGMWKQGEMPTHGMQLTVAGCAAAIVFSLLHRMLGRWSARRDRGNGR